MFLINSFLVLLLFSWVDALVHETRQSHPLWKRTDGGSGTSIPDYFKQQTRLPITFRLRQRNIDRLHAEIKKVSDPEDDSYGQHWSPEQVSDYFSPSSESRQAVLDWLYGHDSGIKSHQIVQDHQRGWIEFQGTIKQAEDLLETTYHLYSNGQGNSHVGCDSYNLPDHLAHHIDMVTPTVHFPPDRKVGRTSAPPTTAEDATLHADVPHRNRRRWHALSEKFALTICSEWMNFVCLSYMYKFRDYVPLAAAKNSLGIVVFSPMKLVFSGTDLLYHTFTPKVFGARPRVKNLGPQLGTQPKVLEPEEISKREGELFELEMDVEYSLPLIFPTPVNIYQVNTHSTESIQPFEILFEAILCQKSSDPKTSQSCVLSKPANVISISYGMSEISSPRSALIRQCEEYGKMALMGITVLASSGDDGVAGHEGKCIGSSQKLENGGHRFAPDFPATCPYVTAVGGSMIPPGKAWNYPEVALNILDKVTGGGFSDVFPAPWYQKEALKNYIRDHKPPYPSGTYNDSIQARGYPDLSVNGANLALTHWQGEKRNATFYKARGTSLSVQIAASIITLINDGRIAKGLS
ncbi:hypothetical protein PTTG_09135, partial [Puccinia triticina 1-1 BBBD Race 1]